MRDCLGTYLLIVHGGGSQLGVGHSHIDSGRGSDGEAEGGVDGRCGRGEGGLEVGVALGQTGAVDVPDGWKRVRTSR